MKKRIGAILLTICMLVGLLPTAALAAETGYLVTLDYDTNLCTVTVTDRNDSNATVESGGYLTLGSNDKASAIFEIKNIAEGYRIAKVLLNGEDYTVNFITGAYGGIARSGISEDVTLSVTLEKIPSLPVLKSIEVYADETYTEVLSTDLTLTEATQIYVKGTYADGGEYPEYTARGHMEYTTDGTTWNWTQWGGDYWYFPLNSTFYTDFDPLEDSYDFRICIEPDGLYCTGDTLYSEVYHVNGGAGSSESGDGSTEEVTGYKLTLNYDADQCSVVVTDKTTNTKVVNGGYVTVGTYGASMDIWVYVNDGYRIENVEFVDSKGTQDLTEHYIVGAYGWDPTLYAYSDCTLTITTEEIPSDLPTATGIELYSDAARTVPMSSDVVLADGEYDVVYAKAIYADGKEYPNYTARGTLEYTVDGETWKEGVYGDGQIDFTLNSYADEYYDTGVKYPQYDYRIRFDPDGMYCTGKSVYSEVYHVNGGVDGTAGGSGDSGSGETEAHQLAAPTDLEWHKFYPWGETTAFNYNGAISWVTGNPEYDQTFQISVYKDNELQYSTTWDYTAGSGHTHWTDWDFSLGEVQWLGNGTYHYTVQALGDGETTCDSEVATSGTWAFSMPGNKISAPTNLAWDGTTATWTEDAKAAGFVIDVYYSAHDNTATSTDSLTRKGGRVWYYDESGDTNTTSDFAAQYMTAAGYYYFTISSVSNDISQNWHSDTVLSSAYEVACDHSWSGWTVTTEATCTADGSQTRTCGSCGATETEPIGKLGHDYKSVVTAPTCTEQGYTTHTCSRCGDSYTDSETAALGHDWDDGVITTEPTEDADGVKTYTCATCGETKTEAVSKLAKQTILVPGTTVAKVYGDNNFYNTAQNMSADGGALTYSSSNTKVATVDAQTGKGTIVGAGEATITVTAAAVPLKYVETSVTYTVSVSKAPLTITAGDAAITFGQKATNGGYTISSFAKEGEDIGVLSGKLTYTCEYKQYGNVGTYPIIISGLTSDNYEISYIPGTMTVGKASSYTLTLGDLEQLAGHVSGVSVQIDPYDATAQFSVEYKVDGKWTTTAPNKVGEYEVQAALTSSDNITTDGVYTTATLTVKPGVTVDTGNGLADVDVAVSVDSESAEITVTEEDLTEIVENADGDVSIDLSSVSGVDELVVPSTLITELSQSEKADSLTISTEDASITFSAPVLDAVVEAVTNDEDKVSIRMESVEADQLNPEQAAAVEALTTNYPVSVVNVSLVVTHADGSEETISDLGGDVKITVPYEQLPGAVDGQYVVACYISDDGTVTYLFAEADEANRTITFTTNHFSTYAVFISAQPSVAVIVTGGSGSGVYLAGDTVTIKADSKSGYTFAGWEIVAGTVALTDASKAETTFVMPGEAVELKATYWKNSSSSGGGGGGSATYAVSIENSKHGEVTADSKTFAKGETVTLTVNPDTGYTLETLTVTDKNGKEIELTKKDGKYTFTMPAGKITVKATFMEDNSMLNFFVDVSADAYYYDAVLWAAENEITGGTSATTFSPDTTCTRAQAVTFLWRAAGSPVPESEIMPFADVSADAYYYDAILWAVEQGITTGTSETTFSPNTKCTRAQIVTFLWRAQKTPAAETVNPFTDVANDAYYADAVIWAVEQEITAGTSADTFSPNANCTRAQIVTFLWRYMGE